MTRDRLLCAIADDPAARDVVATGRALADATGLAPVFGSVAEVDLGSSAAAVGAGAGIGWAPFLEGDFRAAERRAAERAARLLTDLGLDDAETRVRTGSATAVLSELAQEIGAENIVVGVPPAGALKAAAVGSVARWLAVNGSHALVFARPAGQLEPDGPVLCAVDPDSAGATRIAQVAARFAGLLGQPLTLVYVEQESPGDGRRAAHDALERIADSLPERAPADIALEEGDEVERLAHVADSRGASLLVTGNRGRGPIRSTLTGSVSMELAASARPPVVVVPPDTPPLTSRSAA